MTSKSRSAQVPFSKWLILSIPCALTVTNSNTQHWKLKFPKICSMQCNLHSVSHWVEAWAPLWIESRIFRRSFRQSIKFCRANPWKWLCNCNCIPALYTGLGYTWRTVKQILLRLHTFLFYVLLINVGLKMDARDLLQTHAWKTIITVGKTTHTKMSFIHL